MRKSMSIVVGLLVAVFSVAMFSGCAMFGKTKIPDAGSIPSDQKTPYVLNEASMDVLVKAIAAREHVLATALDQVQDSGGAFYLKYKLHERLADGTVAVGPNGLPLEAEVEAVAKVNSLQNFKTLAGLDTAELRILAMNRVDPNGTVSRVTTSVPEGLVLSIKGLATGSLEAQQAAIVTAHAAERSAIITGWSKIIEAEWAGKNQMWALTGTNFVSFTNAAGQVISGYLTAVKPLNPAATAIEATVQQVGGPVVTSVLTQPAAVVPVAPAPATP